MEHAIVTKARVSISDAGEIEGVAWLFGQPDSVGDMIEPGSITFAKSVPMVREHDEGSVVGVWSQFAEDTEKLTVKGSLFVDGIAPARKAREEVKAQKVTGLSLKFTPEKAVRNAHGGRTFSGVTVTEISLCRLPVHPGARITVAKAKGSNMDKNEQVAAPEIAALETKVSELTEQVKGFKAPDLSKLEERLAAVETKANRPATEKKDGEPTEERKAFGTYLRYGNQTPAEELKALTVSSDPQAGYLAPAEMSTEFIRELVEFSPIRSVASVRTTSAPEVRYPKRTSITNALWEGELEESEESDVSFGMIEVPMHKLTTFVDISNELLADSGGTAEAEVRLALSEDFGKKEATAYVNGSGQKQPEGFMTNAEILHTVNGHAANLSTDKLIELLYALPAAYRNAPGFRWAMNGNTLAAVRKLKNGTTGEYIWQPALQQGQPELLLGKPVLEMIDLPDIGDGNFPIIAGDFSAYRIVDRLNLSILSDPYTQARKGVTRIHATRRTGGRVLQAARFRKLKTATA